MMSSTDTPTGKLGRGTYPATQSQTTWPGGTIAPMIAVVELQKQQQELQVQLAQLGHVPTATQPAAAPVPPPPRDSVSVAAVSVKLLPY